MWELAWDEERKIHIIWTYFLRNWTMDIKQSFSPCSNESSGCNKAHALANTKHTLEVQYTQPVVGCDACRWCGLASSLIAFFVQTVLRATYTWTQRAERGSFPAAAAAGRTLWAQLSPASHRAAGLHLHDQEVQFMTEVNKWSFSRRSSRCPARTVPIGSTIPQLEAFYLIVCPTISFLFGSWMEALIYFSVLTKYCSSWQEAGSGSTNYHICPSNPQPTSLVLGSPSF